MARTYAQIQVAIWQDDDFRALPPEAQHLYFLLLTSPKLNLAGVSDWRPNRVATLARYWDEPNVRKAAEILEHADYILTDPRTEEVVVRTFIKHDGILRNPKTAAGMVAAWGNTYSQPIRRCIANEVSRLVSNGIKETVLSIIAPVLDHLSDTQSDTQSGPGDRVSDQVSDSPASNNQHPSSMHPSQVQVANARAALANLGSATPGMGRVGDVLGLEEAR